MSLRTLQIAPTPINRLHPATVRAEFVNAVPAVGLTLSWFGSDGWLVCDQTAELVQGTASFAIPAGSFPSAGRYRYEIHSDTVAIANGAADVEG